ncbi:MAG TPA: hypothetical protein VFY51_09725 [Pyrinomonadaceae bacterium]|nr:hypothetical protein [Pyrinomonadaceae bacterium]
MRIQFALVLILLSFVVVYGQEGTSAAARVDQLKSQLLEIQGKEEALKARAAQLEEALKPENIERSLAGVGSTRPEELRETRRRQLTIERDGVLAQLKILETSRVRLEAALREAEGRAYHESARATPETTQALVAQSPRSQRWLIFGAVGIGALAFMAGIVIYRRAIRLR